MRALERVGCRVVYHPDAGGLDDLGAGETCVIDGWVLPEMAKRLTASVATPVLLLHVDPSGTPPPPALLARSRVIVTGGATASAVRALPGGRDVDLICIEPGVPRDWPTKTHYASTARRLLCVANYLPGKGYLRMLRTLDALRDIEWELRAFGNTEIDPGHVELVRRESRTLGCADRVTLHPAAAHADIGREMSAADLLLVLSRHESYSIVTAEAIACGLPVLSHRTGAVERFRESEYVRYVDAMDADALREALRVLIGDPSSYARLANQRRRTPRDWEQVGAELVNWLGVS